MCIQCLSKSVAATPYEKNESETVLCQFPQTVLDMLAVGLLKRLNGALLFLSRLTCPG